MDASCGIVRIPDEAGNASEAMLIADRRMYREKGQIGTRAEQQTHEVLLRVLSERESTLGPHLEGVGRLAELLARELDLEAEDLDVICRAAELHDVGKIAIPEAVLSKPGPLDEEEWNPIRRHTLIGERILGAAPALAGVGELVRSSHERWDGGGYPDHLSEEDIPLGARVIAVCDAYDAMTHGRPYKPARSHSDALAELRHCAGSQFDPSVVELVCDRFAVPPTVATPAAPSLPVG